MIDGTGRGLQVRGPVGTAPWVRAPVLLLRRPAVLLAIVAACVVLAVAASSGVYFVSTLGTASVQAQARAGCPEDTMPQVGLYPQPSDVQRARVLAAAAMRPVAPHVPAYAVAIGQSAIGATAITLFDRAGALDHVRRLTPDTGRAGAWFPAIFAAQLHVRPGDVVRTTDGARVTVAGIYRDLSPSPFVLTPLPRYWCSWKDLVLQRIDAPTPPLLLVDTATLSAAATGEPVALSVYLPVLRPDVPITTLADLDARTRAAYARLARAHPELAPGVSASTPDPTDDPLAGAIEQARRVRAGLQGSVVPLDVAGSLVALLLLAGSGGFWVSHRRREIRLLVSRGAAPRHLGLKAVLETAPVALLGGIAGVLIARTLVRAVGPAPAFTPGTGPRAALAALAAIAAGLALVFAIAARAARDPRPASRRARLARMVPWELALLGAAAWAGAALRTSSGVVVDHTVVIVRPALLLFPILAAAGALILFARLIILLRRPIRRVAPHLGRAAFLGLSRMTRTPAIVAGLLIGTALPCALLTYAGTVNYGTHHEITEKYRTNVGAPYVFGLIGVHFETPRLAGTGTAVVTYGAEQARAPGVGSLSVLGVDPRTFADYAYTTPGQRALVARLGAHRALLVHAPPGPSPSSVTIGSTTIRVDVVARTDVFPGLRNGAFPMVVVDRTALRTIDPTADRRNQVWTTTALVPAAGRQIVRDGYTVLAQVDPQLLLDTTGLLPVTWIFGYLRAFALLVGAVAISGLVFALGARTRQRTVAYVMSRRMGMKQGTHVRSLLLELGAVVGIGWLGGVAAGAGSFATIVGALDVYPSLPPGARFRLPLVGVVGTGVAAVVLVVLGALGTHRLAERADPATVLRLE